MRAAMRRQKESFERFGRLEFFGFWRFNARMNGAPSDIWRLLLVTYWYPPAVGAAAERLHAFARYLPAQGFECHVLTARRSSSPQHKGVVLHPVEDPLDSGAPIMADYAPGRTAGVLADHVRDLVFPDRFLHWAHAAIREGRSILRERRIDAIMVSFPPASAVLAAVELAEASGLPLIVDLRDRWLGPGGYSPKAPQARHRHLQLERRAIARSGAVVTVSEPLADTVALEHGYPRGKVWVIPNGYDSSVGLVADISRAEAEPSLKRTGLTIAHVGTVIERNRPDLFFETLRQLKQSGALSDVRFRFVGNLSPDYPTEAGLSEFVESTGLVSHEQANLEMRRADALLLLTGAYVGQWGISAKLFEYLYAGRPILCLEESPGSNDRLLLESIAAERTFAAPMSDADSLTRALAALRALVAKHPSPLEPPAGLATFDRTHQVAQLGRRLKELLLSIR